MTNVVDFQLRRQMHLAKMSTLPPESDQALREVKLIEALDKLTWEMAKRNGSVRHCDDCGCELNRNERYLCIQCFSYEDGHHGNN